MTDPLIREALHPYPNGLVIVTKLGARARQEWVVEPRLWARMS